MEKNVINILIGNGDEENGRKIVQYVKKLLSNSTVVEVNQVKLVLSMDALDDCIASNGYDVVICNESIRGGSIGGGKISYWKKNNPDIRIVLIMNSKKKKGLKVAKLYEQGYYDAIFDDDLRSDKGKSIVRIVEHGRTKEEALKVYQIQEPEPEPEPENMDDFDDPFEGSGGEYSADEMEEPYDEGDGEYEGEDEAGYDAEEYDNGGYSADGEYEGEYDEAGVNEFEPAQEDVSAYDPGNVSEFEQAFGNAFQQYGTNTMQGGNVMQGNQNGQNMGGRKKMAANGDGYANMARGAGGRRMTEPGFQAQMGAVQPPVANSFFTPSILPHEGFISAVLSDNLVVIECPTGGFSPEMVGKKVHLLTPNS